MTFHAFTVPWLRLYLTAIYVHGDPADRASRWGFVPGGRALSNEGACLAQTMVDPAHNPCSRGGLRARRGRASAAAHPAAHPVAHPSVRGWNPGGVMHHVSGVSP